VLARVYVPRTAAQGILHALVRAPLETALVEREFRDVLFLGCRAAPQ
jgi:hypothetical protein